MTTDAFNIASLPLRMLTSEVCAVARISKQTLYRRMNDGTLDLRAVDRGREKIFLRADVIRAFGLSDAPAPPEPEPKNHDYIDPVAFRAAIEAARKPKRSEKPPQPKPEPTTPDRQRAFMLSLRPGIRVGVDDQGRYTVSFVARSNNRASTWPTEIILPRASPGPVSLASAEEFNLLDAEAVVIHEACRAALIAERSSNVDFKAR